MHKAVSRGLIDLQTLDVEAYRYYETPHNGDLNIIGSFIPFASPHEPSFVKAVAKSRAARTAPATGLKGSAPTGGRALLDFPKNNELSHGFRCVLDVFKAEDVGVVVRLNEEL